MLNYATILITHINILKYSFLVFIPYKLFLQTCFSFSFWSMAKGEQLGSIFFHMLKPNKVETKSHNMFKCSILKKTCFIKNHFFNKKSKANIYLIKDIWKKVHDQFQLLLSKYVYKSFY